MGFKDRILDFVAGRLSPSMDHPAGGGMTGDVQPDDDSDETATENEEES